MDLVSILVPCYNHEKFINDCMSSLCAQTYPEIELIIMDDGSKDNSFSMLKDWEERLTRRFVRVILQKNETNLGVTKNLNKMLGMANGKYIKILASDDMLLTDAIENMVSFAAKSDADVIFSNAAFITEEDRYPIGNIESLKKRYTTMPLQGEKLTGVLCGNNYICAPSVIIPMATYEKYGFFDEEYILEDFEYWLRVSTEGKFEFLDKITVLYRQTGNSLSKFNVSEESKRKHRIFHKNKEQILMKYRNYASKEQLQEFYNKELDSAIGLGDKILMNELIHKMKSEKLAIGLNNKIRVPLVSINVYIVLKNLKHKMGNR